MDQRPRIERITELPDELDVLVQESLDQGFRAIDALQRSFRDGSDRFDREGEAVFTARAGGVLVGICGLSRDPYLVAGRVGRVRHLYVLRAHRRRGVARALVSRVLHHAAERFERVRLRTLDDGAARFYDALGFHRTPDEDASTHAMDPPFFVSRDKPMADGLRAFLDGRRSDFSQPVIWGENVIQLRGYLTRDTPPEQLVLAGRAVVRRGERVLVVRNPHERHILPGGRIEPGEQVDDAVKRELLEETGWEVAIVRQLGLAHLYYETPPPTNVGRIIYPDFLWQIFQASPISYRPELRALDEYELGAELLPIAEAETFLSDALQRAMLAATTPG